MLMQKRKPPADTLLPTSARIHAKYHNISAPPGPDERYPFSELLVLRKAGLLDYVQRMARDYGPVARARFGPVWAYLVNEPELIRNILQRDHEQFTKPSVTGALQEALGYGLFTSDGNLHRRQRKLMQPAFHKECMERYVGLMSECLDNCDADWEEGAERDAARDMNKLTMRIVTKCLFSTTIDEDLEAIGNALSSIIGDLTNRILSPLGPFRGRLPLPSNFRFRRSIARIDSTVFKIIQQRRAEGGALIDDLLAIMMQARDDDGSPMSEEQLRDESVTLFVAGHETTAIALSWAIYEMARNPSIQSKLQEEADRECLPAQPSLKDVARLTYARKLFQESLRFYPPVPFFARQTRDEYQLGEYTLPPGSVVALSPYLTQRDSRFYPNPELFDPDRWTDAFRESLPKYAFFPFSGGPRVCIGEQFAWAEGALALSTLARRWHFELVSHQNMQPSRIGTLRPANGVRVRLRRRCSGE